jgi:tetratricopeptide (TPR) repeat protein
MNIEAINGWFYDDITARGVSFDGLLPQACKTPLGNIPLGNMPEFELIGDMPEFELIHTPEKMADFQNNDWYRKNWKLGDTLLTVSPLQPNKHILVDAYRKEMDKILSCRCDSECCKHDGSCRAWPTRGSCRGLRTLCEDVSRYGDVMPGNNDSDDGKFYDVKKEIYRLTDRVFAALAKCYKVDASGTFAILAKLCERGIISSEARDNFASAAAIAIKLRLSTYLKAGKQGEYLMASSNEETGKLTYVYYMPNDEELCHFFFITIPLYEVLLQKFKAAGNIPPSLIESSFFDKCDVTMGHVYCRLLKYKDALKCYNRALQQDPQNRSIEIRRISIALIIEKDTEETDKIRKNLGNLLGKIDQSWSEPQQETTPFVNRMDLEERRHLVEVLLFASLFSDCEKYFTLAENIVSQSLTVESRKYSDRREMIMMVIALMRHAPESPDQQDIIDTVTSEMTSIIDEEGVSTKNILALNRFGEYLFEQGKTDKAYRCFERALSMERLLYGTEPNVNMMTSLYFLGMTSMDLFMYGESKFYFESLVLLFKSFEGPTARLMVKKAYLQLGLLIVKIGYSAEESRRYLEEGLAIGSRNDVELKFDSILHCELAIWHAQHNRDTKQHKAWKSVSNAKACQENIVGILGRVKVSCLIAKTLAEIKETNKGIEMLKNEVQNLTFQAEGKALCLKSLGKLCLEQDLASDAENYYTQALKVVVDMHDNLDIFNILECRLGVSKAIMMDKRESEAKKVLHQAFSLAKELPASEKKRCFLEEIGELYEKLCDIGGAQQCFDEAVRTCNEESNVDKKLPIMEFRLELKLGELAKKDGKKPAQRSHYDRAAQALRRHAASGQVDSVTVHLFLYLALEYIKEDLPSEAIQLLLETLEVSEKVYVKNSSNGMVTEILEQLSSTYFATQDYQASMKYTDRLIKMEMDLHFSNPFHEHISQSLMRLVFLSFQCPVSIDTVERAYEFLSAQKDKASTNNTAKAATAIYFTCLGILFYTLDDLEKAETLKEIASQLFSEIHESVEKEKLLCEPTCDIMKEILSSKKILPSDKKKLLDSVMKEVIADARSKVFEHQKIHKERLQSTLVEDSENCSKGRENVELFIPSSNGLKPREIDSSDPKTMDLPTQTMSQINLPVELESFPYAALNPESSNLEVQQLLLHTQLDALEYNRKKGNVHQAAKIHTSLEAHELSYYESLPYDTVEKLITRRNNIRFLDLALQLPSNWRRNIKILKLRGERYLSRGYLRTATINFTKAADIYSSETVEHRDDLCEYSEVLIGLLKSEMLCQNVAGAWLKCQEAIKLMSDHEHRESIHLQAIELLYLGAKCLDILSESAEGKDDKLLAQAYSLCQQASLLRRASLSIYK